MEKVKKFYHGLFILEKYIGMALLIAMVVAVVLQVVFRYVVGKPLTWTEEASRFLFVWLIMLQVGHCIKEKAHIKVEMFVDLMPRKIQWILDKVMKVIALVFFLYLIPYAFQLTVAQHKILSTALQIPYSYIYGTVGIGSILVVLHIIESLLFDTFPKKEGVST